MTSTVSAPASVALTVTPSVWPSVVVELVAASATALWQDLDGIHVEAPPTGAPPTSILWAWSRDTLWRLRLDGGVVFGSRLDMASGAVVVRGRATLAWVADDQRIAAHLAGRGPRIDTHRFEEFVVDGIAEGAGPITFLRSAASVATTDGPGERD